MLQADYEDTIDQEIVQLKVAHDKKIAALKAAHAAEIAALTKPSPQLLVSNPYFDSVDKVPPAPIWAIGFAAGIEAATVPEDPQPYKDLMDDEIMNAVMDAEGKSGKWPLTRAAIAADRAKQREAKPEPVSVTG